MSKAERIALILNSLGYAVPLWALRRALEAVE